MAIPRLVGVLALAAAATAISSCGGKEPVEVTSGAGGPVPTRAVSGTVSGLAGTLVLQNNGSNNVSLSADGSFTFPGAVTEGGTYNVSVLTQPAAQTCAVFNGAGTVSGADVSNVSVNCLVSGNSVGGSVTGLVGSVALQLNGIYNVTLSTNGLFTFRDNPIPNNTPFSVTVLTQPASQTCTIANATGTISGTDVTNVAVTCATNTFSVGGTVSGLAGAVVLRINGGNNLSVSANGAFSFPAPLADGSGYNVTVLTQPAGQSCSVTSGTGTIAGANVTGVGISCAVNTFTVGGTVSGLSGNLVLQNNGADNLTVSANGAFAFPTALLNSGAYNVTVLTQPSGRTCTVANGAGTVSGANVTTVTVTCTVNTFSVGGTVSGLSGAVVLRINGGNALSVSANGPFAFGVRLADGSTYNVTVATQPAGQGCSVTGGSGAIAGANVTSVSVSCTANAFTVGGTASGLSGSAVLQNNGTDNLTLSANGGFTFPTALQTASIYNVTVLTQPSGQTCTVANGSGTVGSAKITNVGVTCSNSSTTQGTYSTSFPLTENPISEGGIWVNGKAVGIDWNDVKTTPGKAFASMLSGGASRYNDSIAHLSTSFMAFPANQYAQGTVFRVAGYDPGIANKHEVELHLRFQTTAHNARGYEIMWGITGYLAVVRWDGALGLYTPMLDTGDPGIGSPVEGDVLRAEIKGNIITILKNGVSKATIDVSAFGNVWTTGQPGMGFWPVDGSTPQNYGWKNYQAGPVP
jgi:hypothetical protein